MNQRYSKYSHAASCVDKEGVGMVEMYREGKVNERKTRGSESSSVLKEKYNSL